MSERSGQRAGVKHQPSLFDRFASRVATWVSKAWFFVGCVLLVVIWVPSVLLPMAWCT